MLGKKILLISLTDFAGSGYRIKESVNLTSNNDVEYLCLFPTKWHAQFKRYPALYKERPDGEFSINKDDIFRVQQMIDDADILHFKGDNPPYEEFIQECKIPMDKPILLSVSGSIFRRDTNGLDFDGIEDSAKGEYDFQEYIDVTTYRTAINPDLNYPEFKADYVPFAHDTRNIKNVWSMGDEIIVSHSPSCMRKKGTSALIGAVNRLRRKGYNIRADVIMGESHEKCLERKAKSTIFYDQNRYGSYGNAAVEAMSMGIPTITYMPESSVRQSQGRLENIPLVNGGQTDESLANAIENMINSDMEQLSKDTKEWCDNEHSYETVGKLWCDIYEKMQNK